MAIQKRRGKLSEFDPHKLLPGESAVTIDGTRKFYVAFAADDVREVVLKEELDKMVDREYITGIFEELKELIKSGQAESVIAVLDEAILDLSILA